jgi:TRAP-type C4-dicarboxylate transport system permease small subunit
MKKLSDAVAFVAGAVVCVLLVAACVIVFTEVLLRYLSLGSLAWADEAARFLFIWMSLLGAALGVREGIHFTINFISDAVPNQVRRGLVLIAAVGSSLVYLVMIVEGWRFVIFNQTQLSPALDMSMSVPYLVVPVSGTLMLFFTWTNVEMNWKHPGMRPPLLDESSLPNAVE